MTQTQQVDGHTLYIDGEGPRTMLMIHGWPDTWRLWEGQVAHFSAQFRCVRFTLPGFDAQQPRRAYSLNELVDFFARVVDAVSPGRPVVLMLHDWGCVFGYQFAMRHPERVERIVGIDVGDAGSRDFLASTPLTHKLGIFAYQAWLALAWKFGGALGDRMTRWMARQLGCRAEAALIGSHMNYPYYITWSGAHGSYRRLLPLAPPCPMFFAWGERKPLMFHSRAWADALAAQPQHRVQAYPTGHWVMQKGAAAFNAAVQDWLER